MTPTLSWPARQAHLDELPSADLDLIVVGGGIVGAGIAWEAAARGLKVCVLDKGDFASGTSSKSSKLLHGGLRYLENFEFGLVFESLAQRNRLFEDAPHIAHRLDFLFPIFKRGRDRGFMINTGLFIYDVLSTLSQPKNRLWHKRLSPKQVAAAEPHVRQDALTSGYRYTDGVTEDARLVIETLKSAVDAGAIALNYVAVDGFLKDAQGTITGVAARDVLSGRTLELRARRVFNAAGPWVDALLRLDDPAARPRLRPTKGVHLLTAAFVTQHAVVMRSQDPTEKASRILFVIPWGGRTVIGTTDTDHAGDPLDASYLDHDVDASPAEVRYLLDATNAAFDVNLTPTDVISTFAGWRPLIAPPEAGVSESAISREHEVFSSPSGLISIAGGKLTAYRTMARQAVEAVEKSLGAVTLKPSAIEHQTLSGSELGGRSLADYVASCVAAAPEWPEGLVRTLAARHGSHWPTLRDMLAADPSLATAFAVQGAAPHHHVEAAYAARHEGVVTLADFLMRRTRLFLLDSDQALGIAATAAGVLSHTLAAPFNWSEDDREAWVQRELSAYQAEVARRRAARAEPEPRKVS